MRRGNVEETRRTWRHKSGSRAIAKGRATRMRGSEWILVGAKSRNLFDFQSTEVQYLDALIHPADYNGHAPVCAAGPEADTRQPARV